MSDKAKGNLVLTRKLGERVLIGPDVVVTVTNVKPNRVQLSIEAPIDVRVDREEVAKARGELKPTTEGN